MARCRFASRVAARCLAIGMLVLPGVPAVAEEVDCRSLDFIFEPVGDSEETYCGRWRDRDPGGGSAVFEEVIVDYATGTMHILAANAGRDTYFTRTTLQNYIEGFEELREIDRRSGDAEVGDFEVARFVARMVDQPVSCFGFLDLGPKQFSPHGSTTGPGSFMVGYDCRFGEAPPQRSLIEQTLSQIE